MVKKYDYKLNPIERGYNNRTLYINLSDNTIAEKAVTPEMKEKFIGGRGFGLKLLWDGIKDNTQWNDPENAIIISQGPIGGITQYPGAGKSYVVSLSPLTKTVVDSNVGGYFGPFLKFSGWDALEIQGKAPKDVILYINGNEGTVTIEETDIAETDSHLLGEKLTEMYANGEEDKVNVAVVSSGTGAEHSLMGMLNFTFYDVKRKAVRLKQAGRGGIGTVFRNKRIKALVIKYHGVKNDLNHPFDQALIDKVGIKMHKEIATCDESQNKMRKVGTTHITKIMNDYDLLPVRNYQYGSDFRTNDISAGIFRTYTNVTGSDGCWYGCTLACARVVNSFKLRTGPYKGQEVLVDGPEYETVAGCGSNCGIFNAEAILEINFYCDTYGIDTISFGTSMAFVMECFERGIINEEITGGLELKFGNAAAALEVLHQTARGEGFGLIFGLGVRRMKEVFIEKCKADPAFLQDIGMEAKGLEYSEYVSKESLAQQGGYGLTNKGPQHDEAWLIFMDMVNNQIPTFADKAEALFFFPMLRTWFSLNGLCKLPWNDVVPADNRFTDEPNKVPEHLQNYVDLFKGVTGSNVDKDELIRQSEKVYNFQRVFNLRMGFGTREHDKIPYRSVGPVTVEEYTSREERYDKQLTELAGVSPEGKTTEEKIQLLRKYREEQYEKLCDAVYKRRGWTKNGIPMLETLERLGIAYPEVAEVVKRHL